MLRGKFAATVDNKGRLFVPSVFQKIIKEKYNQEFFFTSFIWGAPFVRLYPMKEWELVEQKLVDGASIPKASVLINTINYYGQSATMDNRGRILIPPALREEANINGEVAVFGKFNRLDVWNEKQFVDMMGKNSLSETELEDLLKQMNI